MARVVIMQPYVPAYRAPLFVALGERLRAEGHELVIAAGAPTGTQAERRDAIELRGVHQLDLRGKTIRLGPARLRLTRGRAAWRSADVVICELAAGATATYGALLQRRRPVGVWGHVDAFVAPDTRLTRWLRRWQARHASHVLAYTDRGAALAVAWGVPADRVTALQNTIDTSGLAGSVTRARERDEAAARADLGVGSGPVFAMIGGIDDSKRIDLVIEALDDLWGTRPDIQLVVGGRGELEGALDRARDRGQVRMLGYVDDEQKGDIARVATALLNPGRVGLIAVESMTMALPVVTTEDALHGPEYDYLSPGEEIVLCRASGESIASAMRNLANDATESERLSRAVALRAPEFSLDTTVGRYMHAIRALLRDVDSTPRRSRM